MIESLARQWAVVPQGEAGENALHTARGFALIVNPDTTACLAVGRTRQVALIGAAADPEHPDLAMPDIASRLADAVDLRRAICGLAGCYAVIVWDERGCTAYTDPASIVGLYHGKSPDRLASTPALLGESRIEPSLSAWFGARPQNNWIPGPATLVEGVRAVPANCSFTLGSGAIERFWPLAEDLGKGNGGPAAADPVRAVADEMRGACEGIARDSRAIVLSITGGYDSRACLAASRQVLDRCELFTLRRGQGVMPDVALASQLAALVGRPHRIIDCPEPSSEALAAFDRLCAGQVRGAARDVIGGSAQVARSPSIHVGGGLGAILKNYYGPRTGPRHGAVKASELLTDFANPPQSIVSSVERWLESVADLPPQVQRTLMYVEQRTARWGGPTELGSSLFYDPFTPFCSRRIALAAAMAPDDLLERGRFHEAVIERLWPELLAVPFTKPRSPVMRLVPRGLKERLRPLKRMAQAYRAGR